MPDIAPQSPLPVPVRGEHDGEQAVGPPGTYVEDSAEVIGKPVSGGVKAMRERFARQSLEEDEDGRGSLPISPAGSRPPVRTSPPTAPSPPVAPGPPPVALSSKPPPSKTYQSIDDVVAAGAGAGVGLGVGAMAGKAFHHEEEPEEPEEQFSPPPPPRPVAQQETWDTTQPAENSEDEEDHAAARQRSQIPAEQEHELEPEPEYHEDQRYEEEHGAAHQTVETGASKTAIVLFDYDAQEENEINLEEGQIITDVEFIDEVPPEPLLSFPFLLQSMQKLTLVFLGMVGGY